MIYRPLLPLTDFLLFLADPVTEGEDVAETEPEAREGEEEEAMTGLLRFDADVVAKEPEAFFLLLSFAFVAEDVAVPVLPLGDFKPIAATDSPAITRVVSPMPPLFIVLRALANLDGVTGLDSS